MESACQLLIGKVRLEIACGSFEDAGKAAINFAEFYRRTCIHAVWSVKYHKRQKSPCTHSIDKPRSISWPDFQKKRLSYTQIPLRKGQAATGFPGF